MRAPSFALLFASLVLVIAKPSHPRHSRVALDRRDTTDICVYVSNPTMFASQYSSALGVGAVNPFASSFIQPQCVCQSNIAYLLSSVSAFSFRPNAAVFLRVIQQTSGVQTCTYPAGVTPSCSSTNSCNFTCPNGLDKVGSSCECVSPKEMCNGICTSATCPSGGLKRRNDFLQAQSDDVCPTGTEKCGLWRQWSGSSQQAYDCVNTQSDLESCGGCVIPFSGGVATGRDCTQIPGVSTVQCLTGQCQVDSCREGWKVSSNGLSCKELVGA